MKKILLMITVLSTMFVGCDKQDDKETITMLTNATFEPFEYLDEDGNVIGLDVDIANVIAEDLGKELIIKDIEFDSIYSNLQAGKGDMAVAGLSYSEERDKTVDFSDSYFDAKQVVIVTEDNDNIAMIDDLRNLRLGAQSGTVASELIENLSPVGYKIYDTNFMPVQDLLADELDAVILDIELAKNYVSHVSGIKIVDVGFEDEEYCIAVQTGDTELLNAINQSLANMKENGTYEEIMSKYVK